MAETNRITKLKLLYCIRLSLFKVIFINIASLLFTVYIQIKCIEFVSEKSLWLEIAVSLDIMCMFIFIIIYMCIIYKGKTQKYFVNMKAKICNKNGRKIIYQEYEYTQSIVQKIFGLCTLRFKNSVDTVILKDVSAKALERLGQF